MELTKFGHSCVRVEDGNRSLVIDPGAFSDVDSALYGADAILITHEHMDHLDPDKVGDALRRDSRLRVWGPQGALDKLGRLGDQAVAVHGGESFEAAGFAVQTFGDNHAVIHPLTPTIANVGYFVGDAVYHPGDSLVIPPFDVSNLLLPAMAPWAKVSELIDYAVAARAQRVHPIHDFLVKDVYFNVLVNNMNPIIEPFGIEYVPFDEPISV
ncbi:MBL fold metallo-hydrolase [uncultured Jatrophihabitans sp.]|uniref:MBL fold metallo-hydrolase n=1 Tax=uncultured Jatrophihabitans sp. TaxID=1610747 RepID=UPI0035CB0C26